MERQHATHCPRFQRGQSEAGTSFTGFQELSQPGSNAELLKKSCHLVKWQQREGKATQRRGADSSLLKALTFLRGKAKDPLRGNKGSLPQARATPAAFRDQRRAKYAFKASYNILLDLKPCRGTSSTTFQQPQPQSHGKPEHLLTFLIPFLHYNCRKKHLEKETCDLNEHSTFHSTYYHSQM